MLPIAIEASSPPEWVKAVFRFAGELRERFGDRLVGVVALPDPGEEVYESNCLVVLGEVRPGDAGVVAEAASGAGERINPLVVGEEERDAVEMFIRAGGRRVDRRGREGESPDG